MPIDLELLQQDSEMLEEVTRWQQVRYDNKEETEKLLKDLQEWHVERRRKFYQRQAARARFNALRRNAGSSEKKEEILHLEKSIIPKLQQEMNQVVAKIDNSLPIVANYVDPEPLATDLQQGDIPREAEGAENNTDDVVLDPLFCLGGYENVDTGSHRIAVLTGIGASLAHALTNSCTSFLLNKSFVDYELVQLPDFIRVPKTLAHSLLGCRPGDHCVTENNNDTISAPPLVAFSLLHQNKTYWDRQLPLTFVSRQSQSNQHTENKKKPWMERTHPLDQTQVFCLTVSSLVVSRRIQNEMAQQIMAFYQSLLLRKNTTTQHPLNVRCKVLAPTLLEPREASRIVVEGYLPSTTRSYYVELGHVSNLLDYASRGCKTKCGGGAVKVEYVHTVHGVLCDAAQTLEWLVQNNIVNHENELGVGLPMNLVPFLEHKIYKEKQGSSRQQQDDSFLFLPFQRRVFLGKGGKTIRKELNNTSAEPRIVDYANHSSKHTAFHKRSNSENHSNEEKKQSYVLDRRPTKAEIKAEAMCNPYSFLPIGR